MWVPNARKERGSSQTGHLLCIMSNIKLLDVVALTEDLPEEKLFKGQVGTVVEVYKEGEAFEVEFVDREGRTYGLITLKARQLMALHHEPVLAAA